MSKLLSKQALRAEMKPGEVEAYRMIGADGKPGPYTEDQIDAAITRYDRAKHDAPLVIDHEYPPKEPRKGPAFGWVESFRRVGGHVIAKMTDVADEAKEWAKTRLPKRSMEFYENWGGKDGELYPRAIAMIGADVPAVKGMEVAAFSEGGEDTNLRHGAQLVEDGMFALGDEDDMTKRKTGASTTGAQLEDGDDETKVGQFSEAALTRIVNAAVKPFADRLAVIEGTTATRESQAFEARVAQFGEGLVTKGIVPPAKRAEEESFARNMRGGVATNAAGDKVDAADAYMTKRLADAPTIPLGEMPGVGNVRSFSEGNVLADDGKAEMSIQIPREASPEQIKELKAIAKIARERKLSFGDAQIAHEREGATV